MEGKVTPDRTSNGVHDEPHSQKQNAVPEGKWCFCAGTALYHALTVMALNVHIEFHFITTNKYKK